MPDEEICIGIAERVFRPGTPWPRHGGDHPALGVYLLAASAWLFDRTLLGYRLLGVVAGTLTVPITAAAVAHATSRAQGLLAAVLLAVNPFHVGLSAGAFEMVFQILFVTAAWLQLTRLPGGRRAALVGTAFWLGMAFLCNESAALVAVAWAGVLLARKSLRRGLHIADALVAALVLALVVLPDVVYNVTADSADYRYVNYRDHLIRIASPNATFQGVGFFLRDVLSRIWPEPIPVWTDNRDEYAGPGVVLGIVLCAGFVNSLRRSGDPTGGVWRLPTLLFVLVTSFTGPGGPTELDGPTWTWPAPTLPLVTAASAHMLLGLLSSIRTRATGRPSVKAVLCLPASGGPEPVEFGDQMSRDQQVPEHDNTRRREPGRPPAH
jgi:4-amino-4-deoxy-L-arabinose transferase-like glycosyltransferase